MQVVLQPQVPPIYLKNSAYHLFISQLHHVGNLHTESYSTENDTPDKVVQNRKK